MQGFDQLLQSFVVINWLNKKNHTRLEPLKDNFLSSILILSHDCFLRLTPLQLMLATVRSSVRLFFWLYSMVCRRFVHCLCAMGCLHVRRSKHLMFLDERSESFKVKNFNSEQKHLTSFEFISYCPVRWIETCSFCVGDNKVSSCLET